MNLGFVEYIGDNVFNKMPSHYNSAFFSFIVIYVVIVPMASHQGRLSTRSVFCEITLFAACAG